MFFETLKTDMFQDLKVYIIIIIRFEVEDSSLLASIGC